MSIDIMIDLETLGIKAGYGILSIGACSFDSKHKFYSKVLPSSNLKYGLKEDSATIAWWQKQSLEAHQESFSGTEDLLFVLGAFSDFLRTLPEDIRHVYVWGNGADFDLPILQAAYTAVGVPAPWSAFNGRCYRTLKNLYKGVEPDKFVGEKHTAIADAEYQAKHAYKILKTHFKPIGHRV